MKFKYSSHQKKATKNQDNIKYQNYYFFPRILRDNVLYPSIIAFLHKNKQANTFH